MKKSVFTLLLALLFVQAGFAQIDFGPKVNVVSSNLSQRYSANNWNGGDYQVGYQIGLFARFKIPKTEWYVQPEALYAKTGGSVSHITDFWEFDIQRLDFPIMVGRKLGPVRVNGGPVIRRNLETVIEDEPGAMYYARTTFEEVQLGFQVGGGIDFMKLTLDLRYEGSVSDVRNSELSQFLVSRTRINQLIFGVGYKLF